MYNRPSSSELVWEVHEVFYITITILKDRKSKYTFNVENG